MDDLAPPRPATLTRRTLILGAAAAGVLTSLEVAPRAAAATRSPHPALLHTASDIARVRTSIAAGDPIVLSGYNRLLGNGRSQASWSPRPVSVVIRGGAGDNVALLFKDAAAAYQNALRYRVTGAEEHGAAAARILNAWSSTLTSIQGNADRFLAAGLQGYQLANAAELIRDRPDFDTAAAQTMLLESFYPLNNAFLTDHNGAFDSNYWANWDLCNMNSVLAIGAFADRQDLVDQAIDYATNGVGMGALPHAIPFVYDDEGLAQWEESGRDQGHTVMGMGQMGAFLEMAWNLGHDLYAFDDNRFMKAAQYVAKYNLGYEVPYTTYWKQSGNRFTNAAHTGWAAYPALGAGSRGQVRPVWELIYGHYHGRKGLEVDWIRQMAELVRAEGGGGDYGDSSGGYDQLGFGTLMHYQEYVAPAPEASAQPEPTTEPSPAESTPPGSAPDASGAPASGSETSGATTGSTSSGTAQRSTRGAAASSRGSDTSTTPAAAGEGVLAIPTSPSTPGATPSAATASSSGTAVGASTLIAPAAGLVAMATGLGAYFARHVRRYLRG